MKDKILALLIAKFAGVRKDGLAQLATALSLQAEKEEDATAIIEKMSPEKVNDFVKDWRKEVDKEVSTSTRTFESTLKEKFDLVEKHNPDSGKDKKGTQTDTTDIATIVANAIKAAVAPLQQELSAFKGEKITESRLQQLQGKFANVPDSYKSQRLADAKMFINSMDDAAFSEYLTKTEGDITAFSQELADKNLAGHGRPLLGKTNNDGVSSAVASFITSKSPDNAKVLTGKEI